MPSFRWIAVSSSARSSVSPLSLAAAGCSASLSRIAHGLRRVSVASSGTTPASAKRIAATVGGSKKSPSLRPSSNCAASKNSATSPSPRRISSANVRASASASRTGGASVVTRGSPECTVPKTYDGATPGLSSRKRIPRLKGVLARAPFALAGHVGATASDATNAHARTTFMDSGNCVPPRLRPIWPTRPLRFPRREINSRPEAARRRCSHLGSAKARYCANFFS